MSERLCLRCDWTGQTEEPACPRCGAPLYRLGKPEPSRPSDKPPRASSGSPARDKGRPRALEDARDDEDLDAVAVPAGGRWRVIVLALVLATGGFAFALIRGAGPDTAGGRSEGGAQLGTTATFPSPSPVTGSQAAPPPGACTGRGSPPAVTPADAVPAPVADYRFQDSLGSTLGKAPDLVAIGKGTVAFTDKGMNGRTALSFPGRTGLELAPTTGIVSSTEYTIEILFRFDKVSGYRKILDLNNGAGDNGLYLVDGCLNFFPRQLGSVTPIEADTYVQVVLTRGASYAVVGYVDGIRQFAFSDGLGLAEIGPADTLRFFLDDSRTRIEYSSGAVSQIRLYDRPLRADEVAALACAEIRVPIDVGSCPSS